jgi:hypothetical protein
MGRIQKVVEYDFSSSVKAKSAFETLMARCKQLHAEIVNSDTYFSADLVRAYSVTPKAFSEHWTRTEWLQNGWVAACRDPIQ